MGKGDAEQSLVHENSDIQPGTYLSLPQIQDSFG